jgi:hypothetical protein
MLSVLSLPMDLIGLDDAEGDFDGDDLVGDTTCILLEDIGDLLSGDPGYLLVLIVVGD